MREGPRPGWLPLRRDRAWGLSWSRSWFAQDVLGQGNFASQLAPQSLKRNAPAPPLSKKPCRIPPVRRVFLYGRRAAQTEVRHVTNSGWQNTTSPRILCGGRGLG
ncbi:unnamed protein product [Rangifer tarandus platyrhynchus]|uniref:Uncharacterized protein n=2 Tax=Rangifer tarandus platyrhynchus TaxID=3082113 RepID=A0ACB0E3E6_RANTA|nr:unnamed protein product [Rangifer tarandus platyrhynchus]CAI9695007.1 unnamed protein product [Rangifer tarandus platyrhynchus]